MLYRSNPPCTFVWNLEMDLNVDLGFFLKEAMRKIGISQIGRRYLLMRNIPSSARQMFPRWFKPARIMCMDLWEGDICQTGLPAKPGGMLIYFCNSECPR